MNPQHEADRRIQRWVADVPRRAPDWVLESVLAELPTRPQQQPRWRFIRRSLTPSSVPLRLASGLALLVLVVGGVALAPRIPGVGGLEGTAHPTGSSAPGPSPSADAPEGSGDVPPLLGVEPENLAAGTYTVQYPFEHRITLTVPDLWRSVLGRGHVALQATESPAEIGLFIVENVYRDPCQWIEGVANPPTGPTVDDLAQALSQLRGIDTTPVEDITVDGYRGKRLELLIPDDLSGCLLGEMRVWQTPRRDHRNAYESEVIGVTILDVEGERIVIATALWPEDAELATSPAARDQALAIVESIRFE